MLERLVELYSKNVNSGKTPLEDFATEALAGLLESNNEIKKEYLFEFLSLPEDDYSIRTQKKYTLDNDIDCIIDMVIEGSSNICFIENKVNSSEGYRQLERYSLALDYFSQKGLNATLHYCTKYTDIKEINSHNFKQHRWLDLHHFLTQFESEAMVSDFLEFLITYDMAKDTTLYTKDFMVFENIQEVLYKCSEYLDSARPNFEQKFCKINKVSNGKSTSQIMNENIFVYYVNNIVEGKGSSELSYGMYFENSSIYVGVYLEKKNEHHDSVVKIAEKYAELTMDKLDYATSFWLERELSTLLNKEDPERDILDWFNSSFEFFEKFMNESGLEVWNK